jgi:hypothetical protein
VREMIIVLLGYMLFAATWFQSWYALWVLGLAAFLDNTPLRRLVILFSYLVTWQSFMYNYVTLRPDGWAPIPWRDLLPVVMTMGISWAYIIYFWVSHWLREATRIPLAITTGNRLREAREALGLSIPELGDRLNLRSDDLRAYERGECSIPLNRAELIGEELHLPVSPLFGVEPIPEPA